MRSAVLSAAVLLAACDSQSIIGGAGGSAVMPSANAAECASIPGGSGPDVHGVRIGMNREEALKAAACFLKYEHADFLPMYMSNMSGWVEHGDKLAEQAVLLNNVPRDQAYGTDWRGQKTCVALHPSGQMMPNLSCPPLGRNALFVAFPGLPGQEKVVALWRSESFQGGTPPTFDALRSAFVEKFGQPIEESERKITWLKNPDGSSPAPGSDCGSASYDASPIPPVEFRTPISACGLRVAVEIIRDTNPDLVASYIIQMEDSALRTRTDNIFNDIIAAAEAKKKAEELDAASGVKPRL